MNDFSTPPRADLPADWPEPEALGFGRYLGPYVITAAHDGATWSAPAVQARDAARLPIASGALQYGFAVFEGLKAYRAPDGTAHLFRPREHARRFAASAQRLGLPALDEDRFVALCALAARVHEPLLPPHGRGALYLRPTLFADEESLGFRGAARHRCAVAVMPCSDAPLRSLRLWAEPDLIRAAPGGLGAAKTGANYAAGIGGLLRARERGYDDVAWLDAATHRLLGEAGTMNLFVQIGARLLTPPLDGTILAGVTRDSILALARAAGIEVQEREIPLDEVAAAQERGALGEAFGCGTAARVVQIAELGTAGSGVIRFRSGAMAERLARQLKAAQEGVTSDRGEWQVRV